jgi:ubiquinone biosynthesis protein
MSPRQLERALLGAYGERTPFRRLTRKPLAVGTIGQVHRARLRSGEAVIVKLVRPGIESQIARDLDLARVFLRVLPSLPGRRGRDGRNDDASLALLTRSLEDLAEGFGREVDLCSEAVSLERFRARFARNPRVVVPRVYAEFSSGRVLVMEELRGKPLSAWRKRARSHPKEAKQLADLALTEILRQIFEDGHFHADPHAGNLLVLEDGRLGLIDLGLTGEFSRQDRRNIVRAVRAFLARDVDRVIGALLAFGEPPPDFDSERFAADVLSVIGGHQETVAERIHGATGRSRQRSSNPIDDFVSALFAVAHAHGVHVPSSTTLLIKTLVTIEGVARSLDPELNLAATAMPVVLRALTPAWLRWAFGSRSRASA